MPDSPTRPRPRDQDRSLTEIPPAPTRYVQLLTPRRARAYLTNATEGGFCRAYAQGFFLPADALPRRPTASAILQLMDLGWLCESGTLASFTGPPPNAQGLPPDTTGNEERSSCVYLLHFDVLPDIEATLNMGVGMVAILPETSVDAAVALLGSRGIDAWVLGRIEAHDGPGVAELA